MPQVKYIGATVKTDSVPGIGLQWRPGQIRNVTAEVAERLSIYIDTWLSVHDKDQVDEPVGLTPVPTPAEEPLPVIDFHGMDKAALVAFAAREYNERLDKRIGETTIRHQVIALFSKRQAEAE